MRLPDGHEDGAPKVAAAADGSPTHARARARAGDMIEMGAHRALWPGAGHRRTTAAIAVSFLVAGLLLGYLGGHLEAGTKGRPASSVSAPRAAAPQGAPTALADTYSRCAVQRGKTLQLGIEIVNQSGSVVTVRRFWPLLPLGGLRATASQWGTCGALPGPGPAAAPSLAAGATGWLTVTFDVLVRCPQPLPVQFKVSYLQSGRAATAEFDSFADLGQVQYTGCPAQPAADAGGAPLGAFDRVSLHSGP